VRRPEGPVLPDQGGFEGFDTFPPLQILGGCYHHSPLLAAPSARSACAGMGFPQGYRGDPSLVAGELFLESCDDHGGTPRQWPYQCAARGRLAALIQVPNDALDSNRKSAS
jgi:hypothetical protein